MSAARDRHRGTTCAAQVFAGQVHRDQRGRLPTIDGHAGTVQGETVGNPVGDHPPTGPGERVVIELVRGLVQRQQRIVVVHCPEVDGDGLAAHGFRNDAGVFE